MRGELRFDAGVVRDLGSDKFFGGGFDFGDGFFLGDGLLDGGVEGFVGELFGGGGRAEGVEVERFAEFTG